MQEKKQIHSKEGREYNFCIDLFIIHEYGFFMVNELII